MYIIKWRTNLEQRFDQRQHDELLRQLSIAQDYLRDVSLLFNEILAELVKARGAVRALEACAAAEMRKRD
jgi:hypothetical protein